jgi:EamA domain-containing membrane protein RarD
VAVALGVDGSAIMLGIGPIVTVTVMGAVGGGIAYALIRRVAKRNATRAWQITAGVVLILSMLPVIALANGSDAPMEMPNGAALPVPTFGLVATLVALHIAAAAIITYWVPRK